MDILKVLVIIAFVIVTICTMKLHPTIHQPMIIEDANFKLTRISDTLTPDSVTTTTATVEPQNIQTTVQNQNFQNIQQTVSTETQPVSTQNIQTQNNQVRYIQPEDVAPHSSKIKNIRPKTQQTPNTNVNSDLAKLEVSSLSSLICFKKAVYSSSSRERILFLFIFISTYIIRVSTINYNYSSVVFSEFNSIFVCSEFSSVSVISAVSLDVFSSFFDVLTIF